MARFLSPEWVDEQNTLLGALDLGSDPATQILEPSLAASGLRFRVRQVVHHALPDGGDQLVDLVVADGTVRLELAGDGTDTPAGEAAAPSATIRISYADAAALAAGALDPATALAEGRVKVRGDLSLLVAAHGLLLLAASPPEHRPSTA